MFFFLLRDNKVDWYQGVVLKQVGRSAKFLIQYIIVDKDTAVANLFDDFQNNTLKLHDVEHEDFVNAKIETLYLDNDSGFETWWEGEVADIDKNSDDPTNPDFFVYYDDEI